MTAPSATALIEAQRDYYQDAIADELRHAGHWHGIEASTKYDLEAHAARLESTLTSVRHSIAMIERNELRRDELNGVLALLRREDA